MSKMAQAIKLKFVCIFITSIFFLVQHNLIISQHSSVQNRM